LAFEVRLHMAVHGQDACRRVLVIDDTPAIHADIRKVLSPCAEDCHDSSDFEAVSLYQIDSAYQAKDGADLASRARSIGRPYTLAIVDGRMSLGLEGIETIANLWEADPDIRVVLCTAHPDYVWQQIRRLLLHPERLVILKKPFDTTEVRQVAASLVENWRLGRNEREPLARLETLTALRKSDARAGGRLQIQHRCDPHSQKDLTAKRRTLIELALHEALVKNQFFLHYQPLVEIATRCVVGLEALLRWHHPELGSVSPAEFIPIAEQTGVIIPIGEFVLRCVCSQLVRWESAQVPVVPIAVNVSAVQLKSCGVWERMRQILSEAGVQPKQLVLELTESSLMENVSQLKADLQSLRTDGVAIEIDDFGTGYSSLSCLKQLPLDSIKIDRSFVTHLETSETDRAIVGAILAMARSLGLRVVAEGVESVGQLQVLSRFGCEVAQGYYFSAPMGAQECEELLIDFAARKSFTDTLRLAKRAAPGRAGAAPAPAAAPHEDNPKKYSHSI